MDECRQPRDWSARTQCDFRWAVRARYWRSRNNDNRKVLNLKQSSDLLQSIAGIDQLQIPPRGVPCS